MSEFSQPSAETRKHAVIFDVDGTLCDVRHIRHHVQSSQEGVKFRPNFQKFHSESIDSPAHDEVRRLALKVRALGMAVLVVTGREARWRSLTMLWMAKHDIPYDELWNRHEKDYRPDHVIKSEIQVEISKRYLPILAVDDRPDIIRVWSTAGIPTALVSQEGSIMEALAPSGTSLDLRVLQLLGGEDNL
jgi:phosphoglycolate phosphatase-like HAD superfamily hydrolase